MRCTERRLIEHLQTRGTPYVEVRPAERAMLFSGATLPSFAVVAYAENGPNLLVTRHGFGEDGGAWRRTMEAWQEVFGDGFVAARATVGFVRRQGVRKREVRFFGLTGVERTLD